ncbi:MAG: hypothetical protein ACRD2S_12555 [Terriglobales bacterium]
MWGTVRLAYSGLISDLVAVALSYDVTNRYGLQTPFTEDTNRLFKGSMWHVDATHNTLITTGNGGSEPTAAQVTLFYNGGKSKYRVEKVLAPNQQLWLDVGQVIRNQLPDSDGNKVPPDTLTGSYELRDLDHPTVGLLYEGKLVIDKTYGHASYGCGECCAFVRAQLIPNPFAGPPGIDNMDTLQALEQCGGAWMDVSTWAYSWSSSNTSVATLPTRMLHTVAVGGATGWGNVLLQDGNAYPHCNNRDMEGQQPVTVQMPDHLYVLTDTAQTLNCGSDPSTQSRQITYEVVDATDFRMQAPFLLKENVPTDIISSCNEQPIMTGATCTSSISYYPGQSGEFTDFLSPGCPSSVSVTPCGFQFPSQQWQWCPANGSPASIGTIGPVNAENTIINVDGNILGFSPGTTFPK